MGKIVLVGADPELFWKNEQGFVSVIGKLGGTKNLVLPIDDEGNGVLEDNVAAEFNIPPASTVNDFIKSINKNLTFLSKKAEEYGATIATEASASFPEAEMQNPMAWIFGCEPDKNAWTGKYNPKPKSKDLFLRSCGGHVHIGHGDSVNAQDCIKFMDIMLGVPSTELDSDARRRELYGKPGAYRDKPYGSEYRTLSNFWIFSNELKAWVFERTQMAVELARTTKVGHKVRPLVEAAIMKRDTKARDELYEMFPQARI